MPTQQSTAIILQFPTRREYDAKVRNNLEYNFNAIADIVSVLDAGQSTSGSFTAASGETVTVVDGIITDIT